MRPSASSKTFRNLGLTVCWASTMGFIGTSPSEWYPILPICPKDSAAATSLQVTCREDGRSDISSLAIHLTQAIKAHDSAGRQDPDKVIQFLHDHLYEHQRRAGTSPYTSTRPPTSGTSAPTPATVTPGLSLVGKTPAVDDIRTPPIAQTEQLQSSRAFTELAEKRTTPIPPPVPQKSSLRPPIDIAPSRSSSSRGTRREDVPSVQGSARARSAIKGRVSEALAGSSTAPHFPMISPPVSSIDAPPVPPAKDDRSDALSPFKNPRRAPLPPDQLHTLPMPNLDPLMSAQNSPAVPLKQEKLNDAQQVSKEAQAEVDKADKQEKRRTPTTGWWTPKPKADTWKPMRRSMDLFRRKDPEDRMVGAQGNSRGAIERDEVALEEQDILDALDEPVLVPVDQDGRPIESHAVTPLSSNAITPRTGTGIQSQTSTGDRTHSSNKRSRSPEQIEANIAAVLDRMTRRLPSEFRHEARRPSSRNEEYMQDPFKSAPNLPLEPAEPRSHWRWSQTSNLSGVLNFGREGGSENALGMVNMARPARRSSEQTDLPETEEEYTGNGSAEAVMGEEDEGERQEAEEAIGDDGSKQGHSSAWAAHIRGSLQLVRSSESTNETSPQSYGNPFAFDGTVDLHSPQGIEDALGGERDSGYAPSTHSEGQDQGGQAADASSAGLPASPDAPITQPQTPPGPPRIRRPATPDSEDSGYLAANAGETPFTRSRRVLHPDYDDSAQSTVKTILSPVRSPTVREVAPFLSQGMVSGAAAMPTTCPPSSRTGDPQLAGQSRQIGPGTGPRTAVPSHLQPMERPNWFIRTIRDLPFLARFKRSSFRIIREQVPHFPATSTFAATRGVAPPGGTVDSIWAQGATRIEGAPLPLPGVLSPTQAGRSTLDERETAQGLTSPTDASARLVRAISEKDEAAKAETSAGQMQATSPMRAKPSKQSTSPSQSTSPIAGPSGTPSHSQSASTRNSAQQVHTRPTPRAFKRISSFSSTTDRGSPVPWHLYPHTEHCESSENDNDTAIAPR